MKELVVQALIKDELTGKATPIVRFIIFLKWADCIHQHLFYEYLFFEYLIYEWNVIKDS